MALPASVPVTALGLLAATACAVAGGPLFAAGRRALRLRQALGSLSEAPLTAEASGWVLVRGRVALASPLFAPLSGKPCAGYELEVCGDRSRVGGTVAERRAFQLECGGPTAFVSPERASWEAPVTAERTLSTSDPLPERLVELLESNAEIRWLRDRRAPLRIVERALENGSEITVLAVARREQAGVHVEEMELAATGTDDGLATTITSGDPAATPELWLVGDDAAGTGPRVFTRRPDVRALRPSPWRVALVGAGPALTLSGLIYLAWAASPLLARRF
ncbi:MAG TPA: hypothetical protein VN896_11125 [Methylomirabilota bacterium]|jgi:hypothetical protein|nr:hypothetical protein [Methylomirabilota bacterium]